MTRAAAVAFCIALSGCQGAPTRPAGPPPQIADGFHDVKWGTPMKAVLAAVTPKAEKGSLQMGSRGFSQWEEFATRRAFVSYFFVDDQLESVMILSRHSNIESDESVRVSLFGGLREKYGLPTSRKSGTTLATWRGDVTEIALDDEIGTNLTYRSVRLEPLVSQHYQDAEAAKHAAAAKDL